MSLVLLHFLKKQVLKLKWLYHLLSVAWPATKHACLLGLDHFTHFSVAWVPRWQVLRCGSWYSEYLLATSLALTFLICLVGSYLAPIIKVPEHLTNIFILTLDKEASQTTFHTWGTQVQRDQMTCLRSPRKSVAERRTEPQFPKS